jgi:hypothetical protein
MKCRSSITVGCPNVEPAVGGDGLTGHSEVWGESIMQSGETTRILKRGDEYSSSRIFGTRSARMFLETM